MSRALVFVLLLSASRAFPGQAGASDPHAAPATGYPGAYLGMVSLALEADPRYGTRLLDALDTHLQAVGAMTSPREVADYLEQSAGGSEGLKSLRGTLGREPLDTVKASALLLAEALARPDQFREVLFGLESLKGGVGRHAAGLVRRSRGIDKRLFAALREAGQRKRPTADDDEKPGTYLPDDRFAALFDSHSTDGRDGVVLDAAGAAPESAARRRDADPRGERP